MTARKKYSREFKSDAISLVLEQGYTQVAAARSLDISVKVLHRWIKEHRDAEDQAFRGKGGLTADQAETFRLQQEVRRLQKEVDIFKKAAFLFARDTL